MERNNRGGKKGNKKEHYRKAFLTSKRSEEIKAGIKGFFITCDMSKEKRCIKEVFNVLNDFVDKIYPDLDI